MATSFLVWLEIVATPAAMRTLAQRTVPRPDCRPERKALRLSRTRARSGERSASWRSKLAAWVVEGAKFPASFRSSRLSTKAENRFRLKRPRATNSATPEARGDERKNWNTPAATIDRIPARLTYIWCPISQVVLDTP